MEDWKIVIVDQVIWHQTWHFVSSGDCANKSKQYNYDTES